MCNLLKIFFIFILMVSLILLYFIILNKSIFICINIYLKKLVYLCISYSIFDLYGSYFNLENDINRF